MGGEKIRFIVYYDITSDNRLTPREQMFLCLIGAYQRNGGCYASNQYLGDYFGIGRIRAVQVIGQLKDKGFIATKEKKLGKKTIERTITIIDEHSKNILLTNSKTDLPSDSKKKDDSIVRKTSGDSKKTYTHINKSYKTYSGAGFEKPPHTITDDELVKFDDRAKQQLEALKKEGKL